MGWAIHALGLFAGNIADSVDVSATYPVVLEKTKIEYLEHQALSLKRPTRSKEGCGNPSRSELKLTSPSSSLTSFKIWNHHFRFSPATYIIRRIAKTYMPLAIFSTTKESPIFNSENSSKLYMCIEMPMIAMLNDITVRNRSLPDFSFSFITSLTLKNQDFNQLSYSVNCVNKIKP
ncbi:hypothetical protein N9C12_04600 [Candidatus Poseidoniaceae archaeon]|nr:hypothetical protein [Candidatus Poseidoniaceae archaeon]